MNVLFEILKHKSVGFIWKHCLNTIEEKIQSRHENVY